MSEPPPPASLKARLASLVRGAGASASASVGQRLRDLQSTAPQRAADIKAKARSGLERLSGERHDLASRLGTKIEQLLKPRAPQERPASDDAMPVRSPSPTEVAPPDPVPRVDAADTRRASVTTRALGRVGWTAVHARLGAVAKGMKRRTGAAVPAPADVVAPAPIRIDAARAAPPALTAAPVARAEALIDPALAAPQSTEPLIAPRRPAVPLLREPGPTELHRRRRESGRSRLASLAGSLATAAVTAAVLHIAMTFAFPATAHWFGRGAAYHRLKFQLEANRMKLFTIEAGSGAPLLPFLSPDMSYAFCRYDVSAGPVAVSALLPDAGWSLALYTPQGDNFYAAPGGEGRAAVVEFLIVPASDRLINLVPGMRRADVDATQVTSPVREGLLVVRAPYRGLAFESATRAALTKATCAAATRR
jgi:uncharacterized membrane protein